MLDKLKGLFIEEDPNAVQKAKTTPEKSSAGINAPKSKDKAADPEPIEMDTPSDTSGKPNPKFVDILLKAVEENNMKGFDYLEYKKSLQSLSNMDMDEGTRYKSAFAMAKTMGLTADKLISSATHYTNVLEKEKSKFGQSLAGQKQRQIADRESGIKAKEAEIVKLEQQIEAIKKQIEQKKVELEKDKGQIDVSMDKINSAKDGFLLAYAKVYDQIKLDIDKMKQYLS